MTDPNLIIKKKLKHFTYCKTVSLKISDEYNVFQPTADKGTLETAVGCRILFGRQHNKLDSTKKKMQI